MPMTAAELVATFNQLADTPEELKSLIIPTGTKDKIRRRMQAFQERAQTRINDMQAQIDSLRNLYDTAIREAEQGTDPQAVPDTAAEEAALA